MSFNYGSNDSFNNIQSNSKMVFFDSYLNSDLEFIKNNQAEPLAIDNLHYFLSKTKNFTERFTEILLNGNAPLAIVHKTPK